MNDRLAGLLLFLPVPVVLVLFTRMPLRPIPSLVVGLALMLTHPLYARPFALRRARRRCLWCGFEVSQNEADPEKTTQTSHQVLLVEPRGTTTWTACTPHHLERLRKTLGWAEACSLPLRLLILGGLVLFLIGAVGSALSFFSPAISGDAVALFQLAVALAVLPLGWVGPHFSGTIREPIRVPFPVHIQALIGTLSVLWLFRLVGLWWLVISLVHFGRRIF